MLLAKDLNSVSQPSAEGSEQSIPFDQATDKLLLRWIEEVTIGWESAVADLAGTLHENPGRISRAFREMLSGYGTAPSYILTTTMEVESGSYHGLIAANRIPFVSFCAHHFLPFVGSVDIVYEPGSKIVGIGKIPRLVDCRARRFQLQEMLVKELAEDMMTGALANGVYVRASAQHLCVCYRGPSHPTVSNISTYSMGTLADDKRFGEVEMSMRVL